MISPVGYNQKWFAKSTRIFYDTQATMLQITTTSFLRWIQPDFTVACLLGLLFNRTYLIYIDEF